MPFPKLGALSEMQTASSRVWYRLTIPISKDDNHYTTSAFKKFSSIYLPTSPHKQDVPRGHFLNGV